MDLATYASTAQHEAYDIADSKILTIKIAVEAARVYVPSAQH
jgi:hypothetical protein